MSVSNNWVIQSERKGHTALADVAGAGENVVDIAGRT